MFNKPLLRKYKFLFAKFVHTCVCFLFLQMVKKWQHYSFERKLLFILRSLHVVLLQLAIISHPYMVVVYRKNPSTYFFFKHTLAVVSYQYSVSDDTQSPCIGNSTGEEEMVLEHLQWKPRVSWIHDHPGPKMAVKQTLLSRSPSITFIFTFRALSRCFCPK